MDAAAGTANTKVLLHPTSSREVVDSSNHVANAVVEFHGRLGIERGRESLEARRWTEAATEVRDKAFDAGADGVDAAKRLGSGTFDLAKSTTGKFSRGLTDRVRRRRTEDEESED
jgi:hypothetical protein